MQTFEYLSAKVLDRMDQMLDRIDRALSNEVVKQEWTAIDGYEINLRGI